MKPTAYTKKEFSINGVTIPSGVDVWFEGWVGKRDDGVRMVTKDHGSHEVKNLWDENKFTELFEPHQ
jgi:hypothetical protein